MAKFEGYDNLDTLLASFRKDFIRDEEAAKLEGGLSEMDKSLLLSIAKSVNHNCLGLNALQIFSSDHISESASAKLNKCVYLINDLNKTLVELCQELF